jgi:hypothetical protein
MVRVHVPLLLKWNSGYYLESSEVLAVMSPFFSLLWFRNYYITVYYSYIQFIMLLYHRIYLKFTLCIPPSIVVMSSCFLFVII